MKLSLVLEAVNRWTGPVNQAVKSTRALTQGVKTLDQSAARSASASDRARSAISRFWNDASKGERIGMRVGTAMRSMATNGIDAVRRSSVAAGRATGGMLANLAKLGLVGVGGAAAAGVAAGVAFGKGVIATGSQFEQYGVRLQTALGSVEKAKVAMDFIKKFGADTPYEIGQVTDAFITAKNQGIDPFSGSMTAMGDAASAMGKTMEEAAMAVGDAGRSQFERLLDFGITSSTKGGSVALSYVDQTGKAITKSVSKNTLDVQRAVLDIFRQRYGGGMALQSKTLGGVMSNLQDQWTLFKLNVAGRGIYGRVQKDLEALYGWVMKLQKDGSLDKWAKDASDWLLVLWDRASNFIKNTDWRMVALGVADITANVITLVGVIGHAIGAIERWKFASERAKLDRAINAPSLWQSMFSDRPKEIGDAKRRLRQLDQLQYGQPQVQRGDSGGLVWPKGSFKAAPTARLPTTGAKPGNAKISLHVTTDRGVTVTPAKMQAKGLDVQVNTGRAMAGAA